MWVCFSDGRRWQATQYPDAKAARVALAEALRRDTAAGRRSKPAAVAADPDQLYEITAGTHLVGYYCLSPENPDEWTGSWSLYESPAEDSGPVRR
jgi:hypothetical protein